MRKTLPNRVLSVILMVVLVLSVISIAPGTSNAADRTDDFIFFSENGEFEVDMQIGKNIEFIAIINSLSASGEYSVFGKIKVLFEYYDNDKWISIPYKQDINDEVEYQIFVDSDSKFISIPFYQPLSAFDFDFKSGKYRVVADISINGPWQSGDSYSEENKSLDAEFNLIIKPESIVPTKVTYPPPFSFTNTTAGQPNDGIDFNSMLYKQIYMGVYDHATAFLNGKDARSASTMGDPNREGISRPVLWHIAGEETSDGKLTLISEYVLDSHPFHSKAGTLATTNYATSDLRSWLNNGFLKNVFSPMEQTALAATDVRVNSYPYSGGKATAHQRISGDKVYLPAPGFPGFDWAAVDTGNPDYIYDRTALYGVDWVELRVEYVLRNGYFDPIFTTAEGFVYEGYEKTFNGTLWARAAVADNTTHAMREHGISNIPTSKFGIMPIVKLNPQSIVYMSEIVENAGIGKTNADGLNYVESGPLSFEWMKHINKEPYWESVFSKPFQPYKLTILSDSVSLSGLSKSSGEVLKNGDTLTFLKSNSMIALKGTGKNHSKLAYKIVGVNDGKRTIVGYGEGTATDLNVITGSLSDSESYTLYVWAQKDNAINSHEASKPMYFNLQSGLPAPPKAESTEVGVLIRWTGEDDATGYRIYRSETAGEKGEIIYEGGRTLTEYVDVNVKSNTTYYYTVCKLVAGQEAALTFDQSAGAGSATEVTTGIIKGEEKEGEKGFLLMTVDLPVMSVNGIEKEIDPGRGTAPKIVDGRTLMPIRAAMEAMGGSAGWSDAERKVSLSNAENTIEMWIGERVFTVNGESKELDVPPQISNGRTMLPIKFVAENIGCEIAWVGSTREIIVVYWKN